MLIRNLVWAVAQLDIANRTTNHQHIDSAVQAIRECGVSFKIWNAKDGNGGRCYDKYEWTSLRGGDKRVILKKLPAKIPSLLPGDTGLKVKDIWEVH